MEASAQPYQQPPRLETSIRSFLLFSKSDWEKSFPRMRTTYAIFATPRKMGCLDAYHDTRMIRLMEVLMHAGMSLNGRSSRTIHAWVVESFQLPHYTVTQLRYDLRKMKAHGLIERNGKQYSYFLTEKGVKVATLFVLFHKRLCGPLANSLFNHRPNKAFMANEKLEKAYHKADDYIEKITELLAA
jgi:hypothetical protein